jgi:hypothetical protein
LFQRIKEHVKITAGLKMSEFHSGKYRDVDFETYPLVKIFSFWIRKPKIFQYFPYWTAQKVTFIVKIKSEDGKKLLSDIPIFSKPSDSSFSERIEVGEYCNLEDDGKQVRILTDGLRGSYILKYYFGSPTTNGSIEVVELQGNWKDKIWFIIFGLVGGFIGSLIILILGLVFQAIQINPQFWLNIF